jgi:hypothetical protein
MPSSTKFIPQTNGALDGEGARDGTLDGFEDGCLDGCADGWRSEMNREKRNGAIVSLGGRAQLPFCLKE